VRTIVIAGAQPYDGRYEFDAERPFTAREWGWIKRYAGYLPPLSDDAIRDPEFSVVVALIALHRHGRIDKRDVPALWDKFCDAPNLELDVELERQEEEELELPDPTSPPSSNGNSRSSGDATSTSSASSATPSSIGSPSSAISESDPATSAT
jgi:hypothetical protein